MIETFTEPLAGVAPKVKDIDVGSLKKEVPVGDLVPLICTVQGFPAPSFRYFQYLKHFPLKFSLKFCCKCYFYRCYRTNR